MEENVQKFAKWTKSHEKDATPMLRVATAGQTGQISANLPQLFIHNIGHLLTLMKVDLDYSMGSRSTKLLIRVWILADTYTDKYDIHDNTVSSNFFLNILIFQRNFNVFNVPRLIFPQT